MVLARRLNARWLEVLTHLGALLPLAWLVWDQWQGSVVVDPVSEITTRTGKTALILLLLSLACAPIETVLGLKAVLRLRRPLGLYAFLYAGLHFLTFVGLDYGFDLRLLGAAIFNQRYVVVGFVAGLLLPILALTSARGWQRRLGRQWKRLHRLAYVAALLAVVHFIWLVKDVREPMRYAVVVALLLILRVPAVRRMVVGFRQRLRMLFRAEV